MTEGFIERVVTDHARTCGFIVRKLKWIGRIGAPDRLFMGDGRAVFIEFKATGKGPEPHQKREVARMRRAGMEVHVVNDVGVGCALFD